jgi:dipeptidyl aminopeptidase/acylaminoacyl peptidase
VLAVALLKKHPRIDPRAIVVVGHSQGGYAIPRIAKRDGSIAALVVLAGNSRPLEVLILEQMAYMVELTKPLGGQASDAAEKALAAAKAGAEKLKDPKLDRKTPREQLPLGIPASFWLDVRTYQPALVAATLKQPMLILQGERDYQVAKADYEGWRTALAAKKNATLKTYPDLNHQLMPGYGPSSPAEYLVPNHVAKEVVDDLAKFVLALP